MIGMVSSVPIRDGASGRLGLCLALRLIGYECRLA